jgi:hypothetical protein
MTSLYSSARATAIAVPSTQPITTGVLGGVGLEHDDRRQADDRPIHHAGDLPGAQVGPEGRVHGSY